MVTALVVLVIVLALYFTYTNGFQDGSSVTAGGIATRAMSPLQAVILVGCFEMAGAIFGGSAVSGTIQAITNWPDRPDLLPVLCASLAAAIMWNYITRYIGLPSSSTHALVGGIIGALYAAGGTKFIVMGHPDLFHPTGVWKVIITLFVSPLAGFAAGFAVYLLAIALLIRATMKVSKFIKWLQWVATGVLAFAHGANDPQKTMGIIVLCLQAAKLHSSSEIPLPVRLAAAVAIGMGIVSLAPAIVKRVGSRIYRLRPIHGLAEETASAAVVLFGSITGGPVAASQVISSSVMGVGSAVRLKNVHWLVAKDMLLAWFLTIPCSALLSSGLYGLGFHWLNRYLQNPT